MVKSPVLVIAALSALAGSAAAAFVRPITNPVYTDVPAVTPMVRPLFRSQNHPAQIAVNHPELGKGDLPVGGDFQLGASLDYFQALETEAESSMLYESWHISTTLYDRFSPLVELNHFQVTDTGDGIKQVSAQAGGAVPAIARFEGGDLVNLGVTNADDNADFVSLAVGARMAASETVDVGAAQEFPLTETKNGLMANRITCDRVYNF